MKVARLVEIGKLELFEIPRPEPGSGELLVRVLANGICGSDLHYFTHGGLGSHQVPLPLTMGHEPAGVVEEVGAGGHFQKGDVVAIDPNRPCNLCELCTRGLQNLCTSGTFMGSINAPGSLSEFVVVAESQVIRIDDGIDVASAALLEPFAVALHAVNLAKVPVAATVVVYGAGAIGLCLAQAAKRAGAARVFIVEKHAYRRDLARKLDIADVVLADTDDEGAAAVMRATDRRGAHLAFDAAGQERTIQNCFQVVGAGGKVVLVGIPTCDQVSYNPHIARIKELTVLNVRRSNHTLSTSYALLKADQIKLREMVTHRMPLDRVQEAFEVAADYRDGVLKTIIEF